MAYVESGQFFKTEQFTYFENSSSPNVPTTDYKVTSEYHFKKTEGQCLYVVKHPKTDLNNHNSQWISFEVRSAKEGGTTKLQYFDYSLIEITQNFITGTTTKTKDIPNGSGQTISGNSGFDKWDYQRSAPLINNGIRDYITVTSLPVFDYGSDAIASYIATGDTSGSITNTTTNWNLFIDGSQNPLYKLTWNCQGINNLDVSNSFIKLWVGKYDSFLGTVTNITSFKTVDYSKGECKFSFSDISKLVDQPIIGHNPACLLMQLGYRKFVTARIETSTKMGVNLYFDKSSIQTMYDNLGYFTVEDGVTKKTDSGDGSTLTVKDGKEGSDGYTSDDDGGYDDGKDSDDSDEESTDISAGIGVLTTTFKMTKERLQQLGQFLWGASIFDKFSLVNNNPIENIISCKAIPLEQSGTNQQIVLGNVDTGVNGEKISNNFGKITIGNVTISEYYKNFLDYSPYTNVIIYLPYIGFRELDTSMVMGKTLTVEYTADCITGGCLAQISIGGVRLYEFTGNMGIDIPITASNRAQVEAGYIQAGIGTAMSLAGGNIAGATTALLNSATSQYHYSSTGNPSPMCVASTNRTCYVVIDRPQFQKLKAFNHTRGQKCNLSKTIGTLKGFTICDSNIDLSGISATESEKDEIINILSSGFFA